MNKPLVSVCCLAYNHEKYIRQCLDGFVMQKTDFDFEVIVHDDASLDNTPKIVKEYARKYPNIIKPIFQNKNQYSKGRMKYIYINYIYPRISKSSKYVCYCEGDDFWTDKNKLQKQYDCLETNIDCNLCVHKVQLTNENGSNIDETFPQKEMKQGKYSSFDFMKGLTDGYFFHTSSFMCKKDKLLEFVREMPSFYKEADLDDVPLLIYFGQLGTNYYLDTVMSSYRRNSIGSWTINERNDNKKTILHKETMVKMYKLYNEYTYYKYNEICNHWINNELFMIAEIKHDYKEMVKPQYASWLKKRKITFIIKVKFLTLFSFLDRK